MEKRGREEEDEIRGTVQLWRARMELISRHLMHPSLTNRLLPSMVASTDSNRKEGASISSSFTRQRYASTGVRW